MEILSLVMFVLVCIVLLSGYPVAYALAGTSLLFAGIGVLFNVFDMAYLHALPNRIYGIMTNPTLLAVPLFIFMGVTLEKSQVAEKLLAAMAQLFGRFRAGMAVSVVLVGMLMAASTGIVGATVVTMGLMSLPVMLKKGYSPQLATGTICATGTLGQIIPPSIALVLLGDVISNAYQQSQLDLGIFSPESVSVGDLFMGAIIPGMLLVLGYLIYILVLVFSASKQLPLTSQQDAEKESSLSLLKALFAPLFLILIVLGTILTGYATPTEASGVGACGALIIALTHKQLSAKRLQEICLSTLTSTSMVFMILIGAAVFSLVFRGFAGEQLIDDIFAQLPGGKWGAILLVMLVIFLLGFILDFIEITFVVVPLVAPVLLAMDINPVWLGIMIAINLQTSFLTPPFGFALFYLRGVAPKSVKTIAIYRGVLPYILIQLAVLGMLAIWPELATWLPQQLSR